MNVRTQLITVILFFLFWLAGCTMGQANSSQPASPASTATLIPCATLTGAVAPSTPLTPTLSITATGALSGGSPLTATSPLSGTPALTGTTPITGVPAATTTLPISATPAVTGTLIITISPPLTPTMIVTATPPMTVTGQPTITPTPPSTGTVRPTVAPTQTLTATAQPTRTIVSTLTPSTPVQPTRTTTNTTPSATTTAIATSTGAPQPTPIATSAPPATATRPPTATAAATPSSTLTPTRTTAPTATTTPSPTPTPTGGTPTDTPTPAPVGEVYLRSHRGFATDGAFVVVGEVVNATNAPVFRVHIGATFFNTSGQQLATGETYTFLVQTLPDQRNPFRMQVENPANDIATYELTITWEEISVVSYQDLAVLSQELREANGEEVAGEVQNDFTENLGSIVIAVALYDDAGQVVDAYQGTPRATQLAPNEISPYELPITPDQPFTSFSVQAQGKRAIFF